MMMTYPLRQTILLDPEGDDGGGGSWTESLPDDLRANPSLADIPDVPTLAKRLIDPKAFVGANKLEAPSDKWDENKWNDFYSKVGRPESPDKYKPAEVELPEGFNLDESTMKSASEHLHKLGLTQKQFEGATQWFLEHQKNQHVSTHQSSEQARVAAENALKDEWKDKFDANMDLAATAIREFAGQDFFDYMDKSGLGNRPEIMKAFAKIGSQLLEDSHRGQGSGLGVKDSTYAAEEISSLKRDEDFMKALFKREHPGHDGAVHKWSELHKRAYGVEPIAPA